jgi:LysR family nitrogen assimilation transcriptional regulator
MVTPLVDVLGVTLTEAGRRLLDHARGILQQVERARTDLEEQRGAASGQLAIGLPPSVGRTLTGPLVVAFRERFPKATLYVVEGLSANLLEWLALGRIDCAVVYNVAPSSELELQRAPDEPLFLVSSRGSDRGAPLVGTRISLPALSKIELVMPRRPHTIRVLLETALAAEGLQPRVGMEIDSVPTILDLVARNTFNGVLSLNAIRSSGREHDFVLRPIGNPQLKTTMSIATSSRRPRGPLVERAVVLVGEMLDTLWAGEASAAHLGAGART